VNIVWTTQFKKDYKRVKKQNKDLAALRSIVERLLSRKPLTAKHRDHSLSGNWKRHRECHIAPDWLLIYRVNGDDLVLERTGSHAELFR
jgi:mRNA interferase YafQ